jgi:hypothetical protein
VGLADLDVGCVGQLVGAKLGDVSFAGGGGCLQWNGGKRGKFLVNFFCFYRVEWGKFTVWMEWGNLLFLFGLLSGETKFILYLKMI